MQAPSARRDNLNCMRPAGSERTSAAQRFLEQLLVGGILLREEWDRLDSRAKLELKGYNNLDRFLMRLVDHKLLTPYQAARLQSGQNHGLILGPYRLLDRLGAGTASVVFRAEHRETRQLVALKVLIPGHRDDSLLVRFDNERRAIAELDHPHIVRLLDTGEAESADPDASLLYYYAMEFIKGADLEAFVQRHGSLSPEQACELAFQIASALHCAHQHGLVHRDIKPSNIFWSVDGRAKLLDFGLARRHANRHTQPGAVLGTLEYIAPEQAKDGAAADIRADIFALGSTLYFALTAQPPFSARGDIGDVIEQRLITPGPSAQYLNPNVSARLDALLTRMMALDPAERFQTPRELMLALEEFAGPHADLMQDEPVETLVPVLPPAPPNGSRLLYYSTSAELPAEVEEAAAALGLSCEQAHDHATLEERLAQGVDLLLIDLATPELKPECVKAFAPGGERFRKTIALAHGPTPPAPWLAAGVDDVLNLPRDATSIHMRLRSQLQLQEAQRRVAVASAEPSPATPAIPDTPRKPGLWAWLFGRKPK